MAHKKLESISIVEWRPKVETVAQMFAAGWKVQAHLHQLPPDARRRPSLARVGTLGGPVTVLWDRDTGCRRHGCAGRMTFRAKVPGTCTYQQLARQPVKREPAWKRGRE